MTEPEPLPELVATRRRLPAGGARREWQTATVVEVRVETPRAKTFRLELPQWTAHVPGQHYVLRLVAPDGYRAQRSYSVASSPDDEGVIELTVDRMEGGEVSTFLHDVVQPGDTLDLRGPFGGFFIWQGRTPALLVGGGSGVVPLMSMLRYRRSRGLDVPLHLVVSARGPDALLYREELLDPDVFGRDVTVVYTRQTPPGWPRRPGRLLVAESRRTSRPGWRPMCAGRPRSATPASTGRWSRRNR